jgi:hypothetical protein
VVSALYQTIGECQLDLGEQDAAEASLKEPWRIAEEGAVFAGDPYHPRRLSLIAALARAEEANGRSAESGARRSRLSEAR